MDVKCPHCGKDIELITAGEMEEEFGLNDNKRTKERSRGQFPEPYMRFTNKMLYLRRDIEEYVTGRRASRARASAETLIKEQYPTFTEDQVDAMVDRLMASLEELGHGE